MITGNQQQQSIGNMDTILFNVVGIMHRPKKIVKMVDEQISPGDGLLLERDLKNEYDDFAVKVFYFDKWIGYVESCSSKNVAELLDSDKEYTCKVVISTSDLDTRVTDSGREVEYIKYVDLLAEIIVKGNINP